MKISARGRYGVRLLIELTRCGEGAPVPLSLSADRAQISVRYLEQVALCLRHAGFIRSVKGASGGYVLARDPADIVIGDVLRALEGDMLIAENEDAEGTTRLARCVRAAVFAPLNDRIASVIDRQTLAVLAGGEAAYMYFI